MQLGSLKESITRMSPSEALALVKSLRAARRRKPEKKIVAKRKPTRTTVKRAKSVGRSKLANLSDEQLLAMIKEKKQ